jgi:hypothetical protein
VRPSGGRVGAELVKGWSSWVDAGGALAVEEEAGQGLNRRTGGTAGAPRHGGAWSQRRGRIEVGRRQGLATVVAVFGEEGVVDW